MLSKCDEDSRRLLCVNTRELVYVPFNTNITHNRCYACSRLRTCTIVCAAYITLQRRAVDLETHLGPNTTDRWIFAQYTLFNFELVWALRLTSPPSFSKETTTTSDRVDVPETVYTKRPSVAVEARKHPDNSGAAFAMIVNDPSPGQVLTRVSLAWVSQCNHGIFNNQARWDVGVCSLAILVWLCVDRARIGLGLLLSLTQVPFSSVLIAGSSSRKQRV